MQELAETGIPCFRCSERSGIDCPGRKSGEATLCEPCFKKWMAEEREAQERHLASFLEGIHSGGGTVMARDALNDMLVAAGDEETARVAKQHYSLDEMIAMAEASSYSGVGCPDCGPDAEVEGGAVEINGPSARQEMTCGGCGKVWVNTYRFDGEDGA